jgi:hypothetical protein
LADADTYMSENYVSTSTEYTTWDSLSDGDKEIYLKNATKKIDRGIYRGIPAVSTQTLQFPRALKTYYRREDYPNLNILLDGDWVIETEVSQRVKDAQVEEAMTLAVDGGSTSNRLELQRQGVKSFTLGDLSETYGTGVATSSNSTKISSVKARELLSYYEAGSVGIR